MTSLRPVVPWLALTALLGSGCAGPRLYTVEMDLASRQVLQPTGLGPTDEARDVVRAATTLAFNPPDSCTDVKAAGAGATELASVMRLQCGVLMTELEAAASRAGFSVVSWQTLRRTSEARPIDYARENKVDLLFEVNELSFDVPIQDQYSVTNMRFHQREGQGGQRPLVVSDAMATARRCQEQYFKSARPAQTATLDVKMVSVADGRVRWTYRDTKADADGRSLQVARSWQVLPSRNANPLLPLGAVGLGLGLGFYIAPMLDDTSDPAFKRSFQTAGLVGMAIGAGALIASFFIPPDYAAPDDVLCHGPALEDQIVPQAAAPTAGSSVSFTEQRALTTGDAELRRKQLLNAVIGQFIETVSRMKR